jgi:hypothetical protein
MVLYSDNPLAMSAYNIIYKSPSNETWLWNGTAFDKLDSSDKEVLFYSGISIKKDDLGKALEKCKEAVRLLFPKDSDPKISEVEVKISR